MDFEYWKLIVIVVGFVIGYKITELVGILIQVWWRNR
jgi:hypothetical protein